jgi:hypothetical protein
MTPKFSQQKIRYCWRTPKSRKFHPVYSFFEYRELGKSRAEGSALGIEIGSPTVSDPYPGYDAVVLFWMVVGVGYRLADSVRVPPLSHPVRPLRSTLEGRSL